MREKTIQLNVPTTRSLKLNKVLTEVIVAILLIIWLHTSISKLLDFTGLKLQMAQSPIFGKFPILAAYTGPSLEILLAVLLIFKKTRMLGMIGSFFLMLFFTWYVWYLMITIPNLPCSCGGIVSWLNWPQHLAFNISLTVLSLLGIFLLRHQKKSQSNYPKLTGK